MAHREPHGLLANSYGDIGMTEGSPRIPMQLVLTDRYGGGRIVVDLEQFFDFSFSLAEDLQDLIDRYEQMDVFRNPRGGCVRPTNIRQ